MQIHPHSILLVLYPEENEIEIFDCFKKNLVHW